MPQISVFQTLFGFIFQKWNLFNVKDQKTASGKPARIGCPQNLSQLNEETNSHFNSSLISSE